MDNIPFLVALVSAIGSLLIGVMAVLLQQRVLRGPQKTETYSEKLAKLTNSLTKASAEVDSVLQELSDVAQQRETAVKKLEATLTSLEQREKQLQKRIQDLEGVPIPVAEHFASIMAQGEKRSAWRDYMLFGLGVLVSTVIQIVLRLLGWA